ncbi:hypothetical protein CEY12_09075 [Chryseobacterium sp. T16E-39]|uniref:hypothetical protein n=1 Tax=Chryseobacterium sp. T16E-39 TaxID=2015076 RepID=UPI000B5B26A4|nr:hypothetical protein [Chryseobacterium sp. T16E-39]ASK30257.1 hypothetical protein CEY12_09075 [Chryseobacterium sp. T16E-39]
MSVNKNVLEKMSSQELEKYIKPDTKFVPQAIQYAFEILESRGKEFSPEEIERRNSLLIEKEKTEPTIHANHIKAANLIYLSGALGVANVIWNYETINSGLAIFIAIITISFIFGIGYLAGKGTEWIKYLLMILLILGVVGFPSILITLKIDPVLGIINIIQTILQIWAAVLLFKVPKTVKL